MKTAGFLTAALVAATAITAPQPSAAQYARDGGLMAVLNREIARSSELLEQMWDLAFGQEEATRGEDPVRVVVVVEEPQTRADALTLEDRTLACRVAVQLVEEQAVLKLEAARLATRLRVPQNGGVNVQLVDATTCAELERPALVAECQRVSETMDEQIVALLKYGTSHQEICEKLVTTEAPPLSCKLCKRFVQMVDDAIAQDMAHVQQVREILGDMCDSMAADSMCHTFLKQYDDVVDWLQRGTDPEAVCERLTMCTVPTQGEVTNMALTPAKDVSAICDVRHGCFYCVQISSVVGFVAKNAPGQLDNLRTILKYVCKLTPKSCKCDEAEKNFDKIVDLTHKGKRPKEICVTIGLCGKESEKSKLLELVGKLEMAEAMSALVLATPPADEKTCFYCDYALTLLEVAMQQDETSLDTIREYADMICGMLGENSVCHKYVDKLDYAIDGLKNGKKPRDICTQMKFCAKKKNVKVLPKTAAETINVAASTLALTDDKKCFYCDYFTTLIEVAIQENQDAVEEIRQYADMICGMLGDDNLCHQYVDKLDFVVDAINQGKKPRKICVELKFCSKKSAAPASTAMVLRDDKKCFYCDYFVTLIEVALQEDDDDIEAIQLYADVVCGMLGEQSTCHQYVDNLDYVVDALKKGKKPRQICTEMKFCNAKSLPALPEGVDMSPQLEHVVSKSIGVASNLTLIDDCFFCTQIANLFKVAIGQDPEQVSEIRMVADMICNVLSADNKCHDVMQKIDHIIDSITKGQEPGSICRDMHFCPKATLPFPLPKKLSTGGNNCAYCDGVATVLEYALKSKPEQVEQIREAAGIVCDFMPADDKCHDDLKMFDKAVKDLRSGKSPHEVCKELKFCESSLLTESKMMPLSAAKLDRIDAMTKAKAKAVDTPKSMSMGCLLCEYTAEVLTRVHGSESETRLARKTLQTMCVVLPPNAKCDVISSKFDDLIQLIGEGKSPSQACHALSFCDAAFVDPSPKKEIAEIMAVKV